MPLGVLSAGAAREPATERGLKEVMNVGGDTQKVVTLLIAGLGLLVAWKRFEGAWKAL